MTKEVSIPVGQGISSEVYVDGAPCIAQYINLEKVSRLQNHAGQMINFTGEQMQAIIANDKRNHKYYKDYTPEADTPPPQPVNEVKVIPATNKLATIDYNTLMKQEYAPLRFQVAEVLPQGLFILAGAPKIGKSWLVLDMCRSISAGSELWGYSTTRNGVLYIALEDNYRRLQDRLKMIATDEPPDEPLDLHLAVSAKGIHDGLVEQIDNYMKEHPNTGLIAIDTLEHIRKGDADRKDRGLYSTDYKDMQIMREIINKYEGITLMLIHHTRKMYDADPLFTVTGSTGLTGAVDGIWVLDKEKRAENKAILSILNRDTKSYAFKLELDEENCKWQFMGEHKKIEQDDKERLCQAVSGLFTQTDLDGIAEWKGNATALCTALYKIDENLNISERTIKGKLKQRETQDLLKKKFNINYKYQEFGKMIILNRNSVI
jgi:hypothetical protein